MLSSGPYTILYLVTKSNWGGAQRYVYDLAIAARTAGHLPIVASGGEGLLTERLRKEGIRTISIPSLQRDIGIRAELQAFARIYSIIRDVRPTHIHVNSSKGGGIGALAARLASTACIIFTAHGLPQFEERPRAARALIACVSWVTALLSHRTITITRHDHATLLRQPFLRSKITYIPHGIDLTPLSRQEARRLLAAASQGQLRADDSLLWIGTVAELTANKGHRYALAGIAPFLRARPDARYVLIGDGELRASCAALAAEYGISDKVVFTGFLPDAAALHRAFDIYLSASVKEGLPYSLLEAMHSGTPIVATDVGGTPDLIAHGHTGLLAPARNPEALTDALTLLADDHSLRERLASAALQKVTAVHSKETMVARTIELYGVCTAELSA